MSAPASRDILGHPWGLAYLVFAESWERFSYYGMQALLVLYMGQKLLLPGHVEHVADSPRSGPGSSRCTGRSPRRRWPR